MHHKSPRANNCPSPAPAGVHVFHTCGGIMDRKAKGTAGSSPPSLQKTAYISPVSLFLSHFLSLLLFNAKVIFPDIQRAFSLNRNRHRLFISACSCLYVCLYTVQMQVLWRPCGLDDTMVIKQI